MALITGILAVLLLAITTCAYFLTPPKHPAVPSVPFWVTLLPLFQDVDQQDIFRRYIAEPLRTHGAVKMFFASQWNVLVHKPEYLADIFKHEDAYQKSGNQKKIPSSVLASFLGDNIISARGDVWRLYQGIMKPGLQRRFDADGLFRNALGLRDLLLESQGVGTPVQALLQRYTIANTGQALLGADFQTMNSDKAYLHRLQSSIKLAIFRPLFMSFPFLDNLGLPSREAARAHAAHFTDTLVAGILASDVQDGEVLGQRLLEAKRVGHLTDRQFRDNVTISFVAGQENPQLALTSALYLLAQHPDIQERLHSEMMCFDGLPDQDVLADLPLLSATVFEVLRMFPPIGQLINRRAAQTLQLGEYVIPEGTYLGYNCYSTNRDPGAWGADADEFRPERWGPTAREIQREYRQRRARAEFISFHGGRRACLGERFALLELKITLFVLVRGLQWTLDPTWPDRMTPVSIPWTKAWC